MGNRTNMVNQVVNLSRSAFDLKCELVKMGAEDARAIADEAREILSADYDEVGVFVEEMLDVEDEG